MNLHDGTAGPASPDLANVMDSVPVAVLAVNEEGYFTYQNQAAHILLGYDAMEVTRKHFVDLVATDAEWVQAQFQSLKRQRMQPCTLPLRHRDGSLVNAGVNAVALPVDQGFDYVCFLHPTSSAQSRPLAPDVAGQASSLGLALEDISLLQLMTERFTDSQLAKLLGLSESDLANRIEAILGRMGASSRTEACIMAIKAGLVL